METFHSNPQIQSIVSLSWAGYQISSNFDKPQPEILQINASWIVPKVNTSAGDSYSSAWIGIGGQFDKTLIQVGTEHNSVNGREVYDAWYELLPDYAVRLSDIQVFAGDKIITSINLINSDTNEWNIQITDATNGQAFNKNVFYNSTRLSGEWIVERPTVNNQISTLSNFGSITFTDSYANVNHVIGTIGNFQYSQIHMTNSQGTQLASVSSISTNGSSFTVNYLAGG